MGAQVAVKEEAWVEAARTLAQVTHEFWPTVEDECGCGESDCPMMEEDRFRVRCFMERVGYGLEMAARSMGFTVLGVGAFTAVFVHRDFPGLVFKLNAGTLDRMEEYHRWLMSQGHPNLPRVYHVESFDTGCVAVAEQLTPGGWDLEYKRFQARNAVEPILNKAGFEITDLHPGNVMLRVDTIIINDPYSGN